MNKKCTGCGAILQNKDEFEEGYVKEIDKDICQRCFRINNYGDYKVVTKNNNDFVNILKEINKTNDLVVLVVDIFNINHRLSDINKYLNNEILLVINKRDIIPKSVYDVKLLEYMDNYNLNIVDKLIISSTKNYNFDLLMDKINQNKKSKDVYVVGFTNAGKSTMINKILYNYTDIIQNITTSILPSTTLNKIEIKLSDDLYLIDTPGLLDETSIINYVEVDTLKKIMPKSEIRPITYQIKTNQFIVVEDILRVDFLSNTNVTFYISNKLKIERYYKENNKLSYLKKHELFVNKGHDVVISGLGFIKATRPCKIVVYTLEGVNVYIRKALI